MHGAVRGGGEDVRVGAVDVAHRAHRGRQAGQDLDVAACAHQSGRR